MQLVSAKRWILRGLGVILALGLLAYGCVFAVYRYWVAGQEWGSEGVSERFQAWEIPAGRDELGSVLLVHGYGDGPEVWNDLGPAVAAEGFHVRAIRLPGWGERAGAKLSIGVDEWRDEILREANALFGRPGPLIVASHSLGACLVAGLADEKGLTADALVFYAPLVEVSGSRSPFLPPRVWFDLVEPVLPDAMLIPAIFQETTTRVEPRGILERDAIVPIRVIGETLRSTDFLPREGDLIPVPIRMLVPEEDRVVSTEASLSWWKALESPDKELVRTTGTRHVLPRDLDPIDEAAAFRRWVEKSVSKR